jgi:hypothetical protein
MLSRLGDARHRDHPCLRTHLLSVTLLSDEDVSLASAGPVDWSAYVPGEAKDKTERPVIEAFGP